MAINVFTKTEINRPRKVIADYAFEPANDPIWIGGIAKANLLTPKPIGKGTQVQRLALFMGKTIDYILEVTEFEKEHLMVMKSIKSPFPMVVTYQFDRINDQSTLAQIRVEGSTRGFYKIFDFMMAPMVKKNITKDINKLKEILEK